MASLLLLAAYGVPVLFGFGIYLWLRAIPEPMEAAASSWAIAWASICSIELVGDHLFGATLNGGFFLAVSAPLAAAASVLIVLRRARFLALLRYLRFRFSPDSTRTLAYQAVLAFFVVLVFYKAVITPPDSTDALVYHMELPKLAFETGRFPATPGLGWTEIVTAWSGLVETQQLWIYLGSGQVDELLVRPIMPVYSALLLVIVFRDVHRSFGIQAAGLAAAALFSLNEFAALSTVLWAEIPVAFYSYLAVRQYRGTTAWDLRAKLAAGALAGAASLVKYDGLILLAALAMASFIVASRNAKTRAPPSLRWRITSGLRDFIVVVTAGVVVASPLLLRNSLLFGNPIYPFLFGGRNTEQLAYFSADYSLNDYLRFRIIETIVLVGSIVTSSIALGFLRLRPWSEQRLFLHLILGFYLLIFIIPSLAGSHIRYLAPILPLAAVLAGQNLSWWLLESRPRARLEGSAVLVGLTGVVTGLLAFVDAKPAYLIQYVLIFALIGAVVLLAAAALASRRTESTVRAIAFAVAFALVVPGILAVAADRYPPREAALDFSVFPEDPSVFLDHRLGNDWRMWQWINQNTPSAAIILTFEARLFYLDREVIFGASHILLPTYSMQLPDAVLYVRALGATYILDSPWSHTPEINRIFVSRSILFQNLENQTYFSLVHAEGEVKLYAFSAP